MTGILKGMVLTTHIEFRQAKTSCDLNAGRSIYHL